MPNYKYIDPSLTKAQYFTERKKLIEVKRASWFASRSWRSAIYFQLGDFLGFS